jgi:hypothetical protein
MAASKNTDSRKKAGRESQKDEGRSMKKANPTRHQFLATRHRAVGAFFLHTSDFLHGRRQPEIPRKRSKMISSFYLHTSDFISLPLKPKIPKMCEYVGPTLSSRHLSNE